MIKLLLALAFGLLAACKSSKQLATEELKKIDVTLTPSPGTYTYKPRVVFKNSNNAIGMIKVKTPADSDFKDGGNCYNTLYGDSQDLFASCAEVTQTGTLSYYLYTTYAQGDTKTADYTINLATNNISVESRENLTDQAETYALNEIETFCSYSSSGDLNIIIQTSQPAKIGTEKYAYFGITLVSPEKGKTITVNQDNKNIEAGISILPSSDGRPSRIWMTNNNYTIKKNYTGSSQPDSSCSFTLTEVDRGKVNSGTFTCTNLSRALVYSIDGPSANFYPFGRHLNLSGKWQCDSYSY